MTLQEIKNQFLNDFQMITPSTQKRMLVMLELAWNYGYANAITYSISVIKNNLPKEEEDDKKEG
jgi:hypothetical protein